MNRMYSPSPTVRSPIIPLYMRGWHLGQDDGSVVPIDTSSYDYSSGTLIPPSDSPGVTDIFLPQPSDLNIDTTTEPIGDGTLVAPPNIPSVTAAQAQAQYTAAQQMAAQQTVNSAVAAGTMTQAQANAAMAPYIAATAAAAQAAATGLATAPSPRVATPAVPGAASLLTLSSIIKGVPDIAILGIAAIAVFAMGSR